MREIITSVGVPGDYADMLLSLFESIRDGHAAETTDAVERLTGKPPRTVEQYASDHAERLRG